MHLLAFKGMCMGNFFISWNNDEIMIGDDKASAMSSHLRDV